MPGTGDTVVVDDSENQSALVKQSAFVDDDADSYVSFKDLASAEELGKVTHLSFSSHKIR